MSVAPAPKDLGLLNADFGLNTKESTNPKSEIQNPKSVCFALSFLFSDNL
jgi:hypothetical protein